MLGYITSAGHAFGRSRIFELIARPIYPISKKETAVAARLGGFFPDLNAEFGRTERWSDKADYAPVGTKMALPPPLTG
jgi:hypothetical protein